MTTGQALKWLNCDQTYTYFPLKDVTYKLINILLTSKHTLWVVSLVYQISNINIKKWTDISLHCPDLFYSFFQKIYGTYSKWEVLSQGWNGNGAHNKMMPPLPSLKSSEGPQCWLHVITTHLAECPKTSIG